MTFTNKAAKEMRERVAALLEDVPLDSKPGVSTFHSFCVRLLRRDGDPLARVRPGFTRRFSIYDDEDQLQIIKAAYRTLGLDEKEFMQYRAALSKISHAKNTKISAQEMYKNAVNKESESVAALYVEYEKALRNANALDFDDLLLEAVRLLRTDEATRETWNRRLSYVMIDEYQDTNRSQYELMRLLTEQHRNVCVVGDEDQSIYSWRGADIKNILDFEKDYPTPRPSAWSRTIAPRRTSWRRPARWWRTTRRASGQAVDRGRRRRKCWALHGGYDSENEALFIADTTEKISVVEPGRSRRDSLPHQLAIAADRRGAAPLRPQVTWWAASVSSAGDPTRSRT